MSNYDLGSIGWTVKTNGTAESIADLGRLHDKLLSAEASAAVFEKAFQRAALSVKSSGGKLSAETEKWLRVEKRRLDLMTGSASIAAKQAAEENKLTQALIKQREAAEALSVANAKKYQSGLNSTFGIGSSAINSGAGTSALVADYDRLIAKYDLVRVGAQYMENELRDLKRAELEGIITTKQYTDAVDKLNKEFTQFSAGTAQTQQTLQRFIGSVEESRKGYARYGLAVQQVGYQVGDFFVQIQSGTNALVAFGQQATQLAGIGFLSPNPYIQMGAAIASVTIPLVTALGAAFMRTSKETDTAYKNTLDNIEQRIKSLKGEALNFKFGVEDDSVSSILQMIEDANEAAKRASEGLEKYTSGVYARARPVLEDSYAASEKIVTDNQKILDGLYAQLRVIEGISAAKEAERVQNTALLQQIDQKRQSYLAFVELIDMGVQSSDALEQAMRDIVAAGATNDANLFADAMQRALDNGVLFSQLDLSSLVASAAANGWNLAASLQAAWVAATSGASGAANTPFIPSSGLGTAPIRSPLAPTSSIKPKGAVTNIDFGDYNSKGASGSSGGGGGGGSNPIADLQKQIDLEKELTNKTEAQKQIISALGMEWRSYSPEVISGLETQIQKQLDLNKEIEEQQGLYDSVGSAMEDSFMSIITRTETVEEAFRSMAYNIIEELYKVLVVQRMVGSFDAASGTGSGLAGLLSGVFSGRASGGSVRAGQPYLVGEKGPELIVPKHSGTVVNSQQTGSMGSASSQTVINEISVVGSDAAAVRREVAKMVPQIVEATKAAMMDSKRRGGQMASAFR